MLQQHSQVTQLLQVQPVAPGLTASWDLQPSRQTQQQQQQQPGSQADDLQWPSARSAGDGSQAELQQRQQCFLADPAHLQPQHAQPHLQQRHEGQQCEQVQEPQGDVLGRLQQQEQVSFNITQQAAALSRNTGQQQQQQQYLQPDPEWHQQPLHSGMQQPQLGPEDLQQQQQLPGLPPPLPLPQPHHMHHMQKQQHVEVKPQPAPKVVVQGDGQQHQQAQQQQRQQQQQRSRLQRPRQQQQQQRRQGSPSRLHPAQITGRIKQQETLQQLQDLYAAHCSSFNVINLPAMLVRLARLQPGHSSAGAAAATPSSAQAFAVQLAQQLFPRLQECQTARQAANATWALAVLQAPLPSGLLQAAAWQLTAQQGRLLEASSPQDLANLAWGLAKQQYDPTCRLWQQLGAAAEGCLAGFKPGELAMLLWALADTQQRLQGSRKGQWLQKQQRAQDAHTQRQHQVRQQHEELEQHQQGPQQQQQQQGDCGVASSVQQANLDQGGVQQEVAQEQVLLQQQQAARRDSNAQASTSAAAIHRAAVSASRRGGNSSSSGSSNRGGVVIRLSSRGGVSAAAGQGLNRPRRRPTFQRSSNDSSSGSSGCYPAHRPQGGAPLEQQLQVLLPSLAAVVLQQLGERQYNSKECAMLLWSLAVLGQRHEGLLAALAQRQQQLLLEGRSNSQDVANSVWALAKLQSFQPQLLAAAADHSQAWLGRCSCHELSLVLYGSAAAVRQQRLQLQPAGSDVLLPALALWQAAVVEALRGGRVLQGLGAAEAATLLQAAAELLQPVQQQPALRLRQRREQQERQQQLSSTSSYGGVGSSSSSSNGSSTGSSAVSSLCSMTCSLDSFDEAAAAVVPAQARQLISTVDAVLCQAAAAGQLAQPLSGQHVAAMMHSLAVARAAPSQGLQELLLTAAAAAAPSMDQQELAMTAWATAKLFGAGRGKEGVQRVIEAVDKAATTLLPSMSPVQLSMLAWAHGRLWTLGDSLFMHQLAQAALHKVQQFGPQALANLTWAFAELRHYDAALTAGVGRRARTLLGQFAPAELANLTWGLVTLRHRQAGLLRAIAGHVAGTCSCWDPKACAKLAITFCSRGMPTHRYRSLLSALADALVARPSRAWARLTPHELVQLAVAFAVARVRHRACTAQVAAVALAWLPRIALYDVVSLVWALAMTGHMHDGLLEAVSTRVANELQASGGCQQVDQQQQQQNPQQQQQQQGQEQEQQLPFGPAGSSNASSLQDFLQHSQMQPFGAAAAAAAPFFASDPQEDCSPHSPHSSVLSALPIYSVLGSPLKPHHLARLAWSYRIFRHADAGWYLAAGQLLATAWDSTGMYDSTHDDSLANGSCRGSSLLEASDDSSYAVDADNGQAVGAAVQHGFNSSSSSIGGIVSAQSSNGHQRANVVGLQRPVLGSVPAHSQWRQ